MDFLALKTMLLFREQFEMSLNSYAVQTFEHNAFERIYVIEDSMVLLVSFIESIFSSACVNVEDFHKDQLNNPYLELPSQSGKYYDFVIEELTPNEMEFKFARKAFVADLENKFQIPELDIHIQYVKFRGYHRLYWCPDRETTAEYIDKQFPELKLRERYDSWTGTLYHFIIYEFDDIQGKIHYSASYTKVSPQSYVNKMGKEYLKTGIFVNDNTRHEYSRDFENAIKSWKGLSREKRLEEHLKYFVVNNTMKEFDDVWKYADHLLELAHQNVFADYERHSYIQPTNKWVTEELVYKLTHKLFKQHHVIYQHRPFYLKSSIGGQMSYDIYIAGLKVAIEYQGKQHFEPVEFFGGEEGLVNVQRRDAEKLALSKKHGVRLVYINYWDEVSENLIRQRIDQALQNK